MNFRPIALLALLAASNAHAQNNWTSATAVLKDAIVTVTSAEGSCTGFIINDHARGKDDRDVDFVLTAAHCFSNDLYADKQPATVRAKDTQKDLMVLEIENTDRPALKVAKEDPLPGDEVASFGYGYGLEEPMFRVANIASDKIMVPYNGLGGPYIALNATFVPGQSGGPVVNHAGEVVQIVQMGTEIVGFGVGCEVIRDKVGRYIAK